MPGIGPSRTAEFMALFRALESVRPPSARLFCDPFAVEFLSSPFRRVVRLSERPVPGRLIVRVIDGVYPGARPSGVARTRLIDDEVEDALGTGDFQQVVLLGAGFDTRAHRLRCLADVQVIEVDQPRTLREKRRRIGRRAALRSEQLTYLTLDFDRQSLGDALRQSGFDAALRSLFVWEGVTTYLTEAGVDRTLRFVGSTAAGSRLVFTYVHEDALRPDTRFRGKWVLRRTLRRAAAPWTFGFHPCRLEGYLRSRGLTLLRDEGSREYRERYLGRHERLLSGYEFYRVAIAEVASGARPRKVN